MQYLTYIKKTDEKKITKYYKLRTKLKYPVKV